MEEKKRKTKKPRPGGVEPGGESRGMGSKLCAVSFSLNNGCACPHNQQVLDRLPSFSPPPLPPLPLPKASRSRSPRRCRVWANLCILFRLSDLCPLLSLSPSTRSEHPPYLDPPFRASRLSPFSPFVSKSRGLIPALSPSVIQGMSLPLTHSPSHRQPKPRSNARRFFSFSFLL